MSFLAPIGGLGRYWIAEMGAIRLARRYVVAFHVIISCQDV